MCGKPNPEDASVCQFCEARLKPVWESDSPSEPASGGEALPEWLSGIMPDEPEPSPDSQDGAVPDWLKDLRDEAGEEAGFEEPYHENDLSASMSPSVRQVPDWLRDVLPSEEPPETFAPSRSEIERMEDEDPDWLHRISGAESLQKNDDRSEGLDWSADLDSEAFPPKMESPVDLSAAESGGVETGASFESTEPFEPEADQAESAASDAEDEEQALPAWISDLKAEEDVFDWFPSAAFPAREPEPAEDLHPEPEFDLEEEAPETDEPFRLPLEPEADSVQAAAEQAAEPFGFETDWEQIQKEIQPEAELEPETGLETEPEPEASAPAVPALDLSGLEEDADLLRTPGDEVDYDLSWLDEFEAGEIEPGELEGEPVQADLEPEAEGAAYPDWLAQIVPAEKTAPEQEPAFENGKEPEALSTEELPGWLKAMRPVGALNLQTSAEPSGEEQAEKAGPLAGLVGALPAEPDIVHAARPPVYSLKLQVSETQQAHAGLLAELIEEEGAPRPLPQPPILQSQSLLRMVIALILLGVILFSSLSGLPAAGAPPLESQVFVASQLVAGLPPEAPVLVVVDYSPAFSAEIAAGLAAVLDQAISRGAVPALLSTNATGPIQIELLMEMVRERGGGQPDFEYSNLGYLPGGPSAIQAFAREPKRTLPYQADSEPAWTLPALQGVNSVADFALVVLASENPDTIRDWIEQNQPFMGGKPILVVASAQNEPVVRPYYEAAPPQVRGLLGGFSSAVQYDLLTGQSGFSVRRWPVFAAGLSAAVLLIFAGILANAGLGWWARSRSRKPAEGKG